MEQIVRIELTTNAWQAPILPLNYICIGTCDKTWTYDLSGMNRML